MKSEAKTVAEYVASLPTERHAAMSAVRETILTNLPEGYVEVMDWGMISYQVPLARYPDTYNGRPLMYAALASQKAYMVVYCDLRGCVRTSGVREGVQGERQALRRRSVLRSLPQARRPASRRDRRGCGRHAGRCLHRALRALAYGAGSRRREEEEVEIEAGMKLRLSETRPDSTVPSAPEPTRNP